ncbi:NVEALA domain-containing protein [Sphingobacterium pedocola]|uniref:NVEALA protein n=1 Tax=Sphingobacterium pedocola TaxID=2082722 RepID=A0ABR9TAH3_9SPHI|nr:NVEALA domain-containing protein [Sphingobacterium pedocola]MBE8722333.1 hypothetical protein [Sphingobacterium pedocola]
MKKKILGSLAVVAVAIVAASNVHVNMKENNGLSALSLANVEALADGEGSVGIPCTAPKKHGVCLDLTDVQCTDNFGC